MKYVISTALLGLFTAHAAAEPIVLSRDGSEIVAVWKTEVDARQGFPVLAAGAALDILVPFLSCIADSGTPAFLVSDYGYFKEVVVTEGSERGCRGIVHPGDIK